MRRRTILKISAVASTTAGAGALIVGSHPPGPAPGPATAEPGSAVGESVLSMPGMAPHTGPVPPTPNLTPFSDQMPLPVDAVPVRSTFDTDYYAITIENSTAAVAPGAQTAILSYGGGFLGPTIHAQRDRQVVVTHTNTLANDGVVVHLHGGHVPSPSDGFPTDEVASGTSRTYTYPNDQRAATLWYHDHLHMEEAPHVYLGLHGFYLIHDEADDELDLPSGCYDVPIMLRNARLDTTNALVYDPTLPWDTILANGKPRPYFPVEARKYRLRFLNSSNHSPFSLQLSDGSTMQQIATDGGLMAAPVPTTRIDISSAERAEVVIDFSRYPPGRQVYLVDALEGQILRFDVIAPRGPDWSQVPSRLRPLPALPPADYIRPITLSLSADGNYFFINGKAFDPNYVAATIPVGQTEIWEVTDVSGWDHNFHIHLVQFRVLDINGAAPPPTMQGLKDTVPIPANGTVRLQATFTDYQGRFVFHCHILEHASYTGMMARFDVTA